jgi:hypothetical protein
MRRTENITRLTLRIVAVLMSASLPNAPAAHAAESVYAPYAFLVGEWQITPAGSQVPLAVTRFRWGPGQSYLLLETSLIIDGKEVPHFEGMLMWNGVRKNLDMLLALDLKGGRVQEQGVVFVEPDGTVVRDITAYYSEGVRRMGDTQAVGPQGATARFRQTFKSTGPDTILTTLMRQTEHGWVATFPGSDRSVMTRHAAPAKDR